MSLARKVVVLMGGGGWKPTYLLKDEFTTDEAAPLTTPRASGLAITDTTNKAEVASGLLKFTGAAASGDPGLWGGAQINANGLAFMFQLQSDPNAVNYVGGGWDIDTAGPITSRFTLKPNTQVAAMYAAGGEIAGLNVTGLTRAKMHAFAIIHRGTGGGWFLVKPNGGAWALEWVNSVNMAAGVYPAVAMESFNTGPAYADNLLVAVLPAPYNTVNGLATAVVASSGANGISTMPADGFVEATWTAATGAIFNLMFRRTDDDNTWIIRCDQANSKVYLYEKNSGSETERGATGGVAQTFTNGTAYRIWAKCYGNTIETGVVLVRKAIYASATFNATATGVKNDLAVANLITWPRLLSGEALSVMNAANP